MIREWTLDEAGKSDRLAVFGKQFEDESSFVKVKSEHTFSRYLCLMQMGIAYILVDVDEEDNIRGFIGFTISEDINYPRFIGTELVWFVDPRFRGIGKALVEAYEKFCKDKGCEGVVMTHMADSMADTLSKFYTKNGYKLMECNYFKEV